MIDELADVETSRNPEPLKMADYTAKSSDITIDTYTKIGQLRFMILEKQGLDLDEIRKRMVIGIDYTRRVVPYEPYIPIKDSEYQKPRYRFKYSRSFTRSK